MRTGRTLIGVGATALVMVLAAGAPALAHNSLTGSDPADEETLEQAPEQVRLTFLASLDPLNSHLAVTGPGGQPAEVGEPSFDGRSVTIPLRAGPAGEYRVAYEVLSSDGDWVDGAVRFTVSVGESPSPPPRSPSPEPPAPASPPGSPAAPAVLPVAGDQGGSTRWWPWLLAALGLAAAGTGFASYRYRRQRASQTG